MRKTSLPFLAIAVAAGLVGAWAGLTRMGWQLALPLPRLVVAHGPLMISGLLGAVIGLERAVALGRPWTYLGPALAGLGAALSVAGRPVVAAALITLASLHLVFVFAVIVRRHPARYTLTMGAGALAWAAANGLWLAGQPVSAAVHGWSAFLVLTIAGERLELSRVTRLSRRSQTLFVIVVAAVLAGLVLAVLIPAAGVRVLGAGYVALAAWLLTQDVARYTVRKAGLIRFIAACLLAGYGWLGIGGALMLAAGNMSAGLLYDAMLHAVFVGFVMSMIFGHAPIILPAITGLDIQYRPAFYAHLALLHVTLIMRIAGDVLALPALRRWGGMGNLASALLFVAIMAWSRRRRDQAEAGQAQQA